MFKLFILFAVMPIVEIALLLEVGEIIGGWSTLLIVIVTAFIGASLVKQEGIQTFTNAQQKMQSGQIPSQEIAEGLLLLIAGVLLVTPGFVTDVIGLLFSMPITRPLIAKIVAKQILRNVKVQGQFSSGSPFSSYSTHTQHHNQHRPFDQGSQHDPTAPFNQSTTHHHASDSFEGEIIDGEIIDSEHISENSRTKRLESDQEPLYKNSN